MTTVSMTAAQRETRIRNGRFTNSAHGMPWNKNGSPKDYSKVTAMANANNGR